MWFKRDKHWSLLSCLFVKHLNLILIQYCRLHKCELFLSLISGNLVYFTGSAESHCATLDSNVYIRILKPGVCLIFTFCWFNFTYCFYCCECWLKNIMQSMWKKYWKNHRTFSLILLSNLPVLQAHFMSISSFLNPLSYHTSGHATQEKSSYHLWCFHICSLELYSYFGPHETPFHPRGSWQPGWTW